jgi:hypothetical protein
MVRLTTVLSNGRRAAPSQSNTPSRGLTRRNGASGPGSSSGLISRQSLITLGVGIMFGYILLPLLLIEMDIEETLSALPMSQMTTPSTTYPASTYLRPNEIIHQRTLDVAAQPGFAMSDVEKRLIEDHDVLATQSLPTSTTPWVMKTPKLPDHNRKKILVTGGAGFVGSHLVDKLMMEGHEVIVVDNFFTGQKKNIAHWLHHPYFR